MKDLKEGFLGQGNLQVRLFLNKGVLEMRKRIKEYEHYFIYDNGDVLNKITNKVLKGSIGENGYKYYRLSKDGNKKMFYAHRLVAEYFIANPNNLPVVNHKDGNKLNNEVSNLEWVTYSENISHAHQNNLIKERQKSEFFQENLDNEVWKKIPKYHYSVSSKGRIRNDETFRLLRPSLTNGYYKVRLSKNGQVKDILVHRLIYCVFNDLDEIPEGHIIDHKDTNKLNNRLDNLRLLTCSENVKQAYYVQKVNSSCKEVEQLTLDDKFIRSFPSCAEAARELHLDGSTISKVCRGINKSHGGFHFRYKE